VLTSFLGLVAFAGFEATFSLLTAERFGLSESATYAVFFGIGIGLVLVQGGLVHPVVSHLGEPATMRVGLVCNAVGLLLLAPPEGGWWLLVPALTLLVAGQGVLAPTLSSAVAARAADRARGESLGIQQAAGGLARVVGPALAGVLFERIGPAAPYYVGAGLVTAALLVLGSVDAAPAELDPAVTDR
jgi:predicted MFS family arabinose efflux permease